MISDFVNYFETWSDELKARADCVRSLIGSAHWLSDGQHKEHLLKEFLERYLPTRVRISSGFIRPSNPTSCCSPEIDLLIVDDVSEPAYFVSDGLQIVPPSAVLGNLQAKSELTKSSLQEAISNQIASQHVLRDEATPSKVWRGALFTSLPDTRTEDSIAATLIDILGDFNGLIDKMPKAITNRPSSLCIDLLPQCIATLDGFVIYIGQGESEQVVKTRVFNAGKVAAACLIGDLVAHVVERFGSTNSISNYELAIAECVRADPVIKELNIGVRQ